MIHDKKYLCPGIMALMVVLLLFTSSLTAAADLKVGIINTGKILAESDYGKKLQDRFGEKMKEQRDDLEKKRREVETNQNLLAKARENRQNPEEISELKEALEKSVREFKWKKNDLDKKLREMDQELVRDMRAKLKIILAQYVEDTDYAVIVEKQRVAAASSRVDVTSDIIRLLDRHYD
ncbi:MAG: OmpH family outer membrane protein [Desulfosudaceae bacterium]